MRRSVWISGVVATALAVASCKSEPPRDVSPRSDDGGTSLADSGRDAGALSRVVMSTPAFGDRDVYPAAIEGGTGEVVVFTLAFASLMRPEQRTASLSDGVSDVDLVGVWSDDGRTISFTVRGSPFTGEAPLLDSQAYALDLSSLRDFEDRAVEPNIGLRDRRLEFSTGARDPLLNHSCGHVTFGPFASANAEAAPSIATDRVDQPHHRYTVTLPSRGDGGYSGYVGFVAASTGTYHLFFDSAIPLAIRDAEGSERGVPMSESARACVGITHRAAFEATVNDRIHLQLGPTPREAVHVIVEAEPD